MWQLPEVKPCLYSLVYLQIPALKYPPSESALVVNSIAAVSVQKRNTFPSARFIIPFSCCTLHVFIIHRILLIIPISDARCLIWSTASQAGVWKLRRFVNWFLIAGFGISNHTLPLKQKMEYHAMFIKFIPSTHHLILWLGKCTPCFLKPHNLVCIVYLRREFCFPSSLCICEFRFN